MRATAGPSGEGECMWNERRSCREWALLRAEAQQTCHRKDSWQATILYSLVSGALATVAGAVASLAVTGTARLAVWGTVTCAISVVAGLVHGSGPVNACRSAGRRWLRRLATS